MVGVLAGSLAPIAPAGAADPKPYASSAASRYQVTFAARSCGGYQDIAANQVRDDSAGTLARPGRDSPYQPGQPVDPDVEDNVDSGCTDLTGWRFTLGGGHDAKGVTGVSSTTPPTQESGSRLDSVGKDTGGLLGGAAWQEQVDQWLPTPADEEYVASLMVPVYEPGKMANWIAPPATGINDKPVDYEYVRFEQRR